MFLIPKINEMRWPVSYLENVRIKRGISHPLNNHMEDRSIVEIRDLEPDRWLFAMNTYKKTYMHKVVYIVTHYVTL